MQTISINFIVPQWWHEFSDKQLRYVYQLLAQNITSDEVKVAAMTKSLYCCPLKILSGQ